MTPENFCYWLQGHFELGGNSTPESINVIKEHLNLVFKKETGNKRTFAVTDVDAFKKVYDEYLKARENYNVRYPMVISDISPDPYGIFYTPMYNINDMVMASC